MKTLDVRNASKSLADYTAELDSESIVITSNEKPVAALISLRGLDRESVALSLSPDFAKIIRVARSEARRGNVFSLDEVNEPHTRREDPRRATCGIRIFCGLERLCFPPGRHAKFWLEPVNLASNNLKDSCRG